MNTHNDSSLFQTVVEIRDRLENLVTQVIATPDKRAVEPLNVALHQIRDAATILDAQGHAINDLRESLIDNLNRPELKKLVSLVVNEKPNSDPTVSQFLPFVAGDLACNVLDIAHVWRFTNENGGVMTSISWKDESKLPTVLSGDYLAAYAGAAASLLVK